MISSFLISDLVELIYSRVYRSLCCFGSRSSHEIIERTWEIFYWSYEIKSFYQQFLRLCNEKPFQYPFAHINMQTMGRLSRCFVVAAAAVAVSDITVVRYYIVPNMYRWYCLCCRCYRLLECGQNCFILSFHQKSKTLLKTRKQFNFNTIPFFRPFRSLSF